VTAPDDFIAEPEEAPYRPGRDRSFGALFGALADDLRKLLRLEIALFKLELSEKLRRLSRGLTAVAIGGFLAFSAWLVLLAAAVLGLSSVLHPWLAALVVGVATLLVAGVALYLGKRWLDAQRLLPRRTLNALREDRAWIKERVS
jgi:Putative Actinobacterial Holin-X, holin superfamily III